jgi:hypothetical protein
MSDLLGKWRLEPAVRALSHERLPNVAAMIVVSELGALDRSRTRGR